jgi:hypothetical protein
VTVTEGDRTMVASQRKDAPIADSERLSADRIEERGPRPAADHPFCIGVVRQVSAM